MAELEDAVKFSYLATFTNFSMDPRDKEGQEISPLTCKGQNILCKGLHCLLEDSAQCSKLHMNPRISK